MNGCAGPEDTAQVSPRPAAGDRADLCRRIDAVLAHARDARRLDASVHGAWQVVHGILAFGPEFPLVHDEKKGSALEYLLAGGRLTGWQLRPGAPGVVAVVEEGSTMGQGHPDQWLGYLAHCGIGKEGGPGGISLDTPLVVADRRFTVADLLAQAQHDIRPGQEATWTLMALSHWLPPDAAWTAGDGESWTTERVVIMEARADVPSAACGGAHRLYGLATALAVPADRVAADDRFREEPRRGGASARGERGDDARMRGQDGLAVELERGEALEACLDEEARCAHGRGPAWHGAGPRVAGRKPRDAMLG